MQRQLEKVKEYNALKEKKESLNEAYENVKKELENSSGGNEISYDIEKYEEGENRYSI